MFEAYRTKPNQIEAVKLTAENVDDLANVVGGRAVQERDPETGNVYVGLNIPTLEGTMRASEGDFVIHGTHGEYYPCKPDIFNHKYEVI